MVYLDSSKLPMPEEMPEIAYADKWLQRFLTYLGLPTGVLLVIFDKTYLATGCFVWLAVALGYSVIKRLRKSEVIELCLDDNHSLISDNKINYRKLLSENESVIEKLHNEVLKPEPNIVFIQSSIRRVDFNGFGLVWRESKSFGENSLIVNFGNEPLVDRKIGKLDSVNAQIEFRNKKGKIYHIVNYGIWLEMQTTAWFEFGARRNLTIASHSRTGGIWIAEHKNFSKKELKENYYQVRIRLIGENQWMKTFDFILTIDKNKNMTIKEKG